MAASAGTNPGSTPEGVVVGVGVGDGDTLAEGVGESDASGEGDALGVERGAGLSAAVGVHPATTPAIANADKPPAIRRRAVPLAMDIGRGGWLRACTRRRPGEKLLPYA
jgi:hypothetical protein